MRKTLITFLALMLMLTLLPINFLNAADLSSRLKGRILLQVESNGEAYYVNPTDKKRYYMGRPIDAFLLMRKLGIGIKNSDLEKIPLGFHWFTGVDQDGDDLSDMLEDAIGTDKTRQDSDNDGFDDKTEVSNGFNPLGSGRLNIDNSFARAHSGKIFLQVENNGEAWYVFPGDNKRYYLGHPRHAFSIMESLGLGITNSDLQTIELANNIIEEVVKLGWAYAKTTKNVLYDERIIPSADPQSFQVLGQYVAKDKICLHKISFIPQPII